jgi:hypothetical protein
LCVVKRVWPAWLLLFLGAFLLTTGFIAKFWAPDHAERTPLDSYQRTYLTGEADKLDPTTGKTSHVPVKVTNITAIDPNKSDDDVIVFATSTCVNVDQGNPPDCLPKSDPRMITDSQLNFASDRRTAMAVDNPKYVSTDVPVQGLVNKWPFNNGDKTYPVWDDVTQTAPPAEYVGTATIDGLKVNQYHQVITKAPIGLGNGIKGFYTLDETYSIDPRTGKIIDQKVHDLRTVKDGGAVAIDLNAEYTTQTIADNVKTAKDGAAQLKLLLTTLPLVGFVVGAICLLLGLLLLVLRSRRTGSTSTSSSTAPSTGSPKTA